MLRGTLQLSIRCMKKPNFLRFQRIESVVQRFGQQWSSRTPIGVVNEQILLDPEESAVPKPRKHVMSEDLEHRPLKIRKKHVRPKKKQRDDSDETFKEDGSLRIIKYDQKDRSLAQLILALRSRKDREKTNRIIIEGHRMIQDAIDANIKPEIILFSRKPDIEKLKLPATGVQLYKVPYQTLQLWSTLTTSPGMIGIFKAPELFENKFTSETLPITIICDNVREPGNLGTILRAAAGVGCERVILTQGCVDVWDSKVLRSAAGAHFRLSIYKSVEWSDIESLTSSTASIFVADNDATMVKDKSDENSMANNFEDSDDTNFENFEESDQSSEWNTQHSVELNFANFQSSDNIIDEKSEEIAEANSLDKNVKESSAFESENSKAELNTANFQSSDNSVNEKSEEIAEANSLDKNVKESSASESENSKAELNTANFQSSDNSVNEKSEDIVETDRVDSLDKNAEESSSRESENLTEFTELKNGTKDQTKLEENYRKVSMKELASRIPVIPYYSPNYATNEIILIVGGETEGLSYESIQMIQKREGVRVNIPMANNVESLNTAMALGIIVFEIKKQFAVRQANSKRHNLSS